jgi:ribosome-associated protein
MQVTRSIAVPEDELKESFIRASGPGGQNVNKVASAVELRFDALASPSLSDDLKSRLGPIAGRRMTLEGVIVIRAESHRSQERNRADARARLAEILRAAAHRPKVRRKTKPSFASKQRRLETKAKRSGVKKLRTSRPSLD